MNEKEMKKYRKWEKKMMRKHGFIVHCISGGVADGPEYIDIHTHGLIKSFNLPELQLVIPMDQSLAMAVFNSLIADMRKNISYVLAAQSYEMPYVVTLPSLNTEIICVLKWAVDCNGDDIIRVIVSDENLLFANDEKCNPIYAKQESVKMKPLNGPDDE